MRMSRLVLVLALSHAARASADPADAESRARLHYEIASGFYNLGNYSEAVKEFVAGYELSKKPEFLIDLGQCYRRLSQPEKAVEMFRKYLADAPATEVERRKATEKVLAEIERDLAARPGSAPIALPAPALTPPREAAPAVAVQAVAPPPRTSSRRRLWWILPAVVVVAAAVSLGVYFGTRPGVDCGAARFGCVAFPGAP
jgi:tetratricopeptide (TPR) repeat protein